MKFYSRIKVTDESAQGNRAVYFNENLNQKDLAVDGEIHKAIEKMYPKIGNEWIDKEGFVWFLCDSDKNTIAPVPTKEMPGFGSLVTNQGKPIKDRVSWWTKLTKIIRGLR